MAVVTLRARLATIAGIGLCIDTLLANCHQAAATPERAGTFATEFSFIAGITAFSAVQGVRIEVTAGVIAELCAFDTDEHAGPAKAGEPVVAALVASSAVVRIVLKIHTLIVAKLKATGAGGIHIIFRDII